jgi:hypothetical protein
MLHPHRPPPKRFLIVAPRDGSHNDQFCQDEELKIPSIPR